MKMTKIVNAVDALLGGTRSAKISTPKPKAKKVEKVNRKTSGPCAASNKTAIEAVIGPQKKLTARQRFVKNFNRLRREYFGGRKGEQGWGR